MGTIEDRKSTLTEWTDDGLEWPKLKNRAQKRWGDDVEISHGVDRNYRARDPHINIECDDGGIILKGDHVNGYRFSEVYDDPAESAAYQVRDHIEWIRSLHLDVSNSALRSSIRTIRRHLWLNTVGCTPPALSDENAIELMFEIAGKANDKELVSEIRDLEREAVKQHEEPRTRPVVKDLRDRAKMIISARREREAYSTA